jgi:hypothetical protein
VCRKTCRSIGKRRVDKMEDSSIVSEKWISRKTEGQTIKFRGNLSLDAIHDKIS